MRNASVWALAIGIVLIVVSATLVGALVTGNWAPSSDNREDQETCETILFGEC